ncbi:MAG: MBL fold metallo-hydrolase [Acidobacteriota bacterium]|nr:MBL fold metallo-hydrolase [Blastocatellia bacterium]MDW8240281.1 MBL fold metallo-hydrolase [Acidobacteriota bacterium]
MSAKWLMVLCCLAVAVKPTLAQQDFSNVQMKTTPVSGHVYMLEGAGGNIGVSAGPDGILIVDDQFAPLAEKIRAALKAINPGKLKFVLNTHWHGDHTGSNRIFGAEATIIAHENVRKRLMTDQHLLGRHVPAEPKEAWPVITFDESLTIHFNDDEIRMIHFPHGHTDGDSIIFFTKANVVHMGDDFFAGRFPFVDLNSGGSVDGLIKNVETLIRQLSPDVKIIPGHGPLSTLDDLRAYHRMLVETTSLIRLRIAAGKTLEQIKAEGLPDQWKSWGSGFISTERWIEIVYNSLTKK